MKRKQILAAACVCLVPAVVAAGLSDSNPTAAGDAADTGRLPARQRALDQRGGVVIDANDALVRKTVQAYGGNYIRQGDATLLILNGKVYKTLVIRVVDSRQVIIETEDGVFTLDVP